MSLYAESSAVLAWLLEEETSEEVRKTLGAAEIVVASVLTLVECERVIHRAFVTGRLLEADAAAVAARLNRAAASWVVLRLGDEIVERSRRPFPVEPTRTLDALHLATALEARSALPETAILSLDRRVRACGARLGFEVLPSSRH